MKILIAEDDLASRRFMLRLLSRHGTCYAAADGREAVQAYSTALEAGGGYALICLDIIMPEADGYQALQEIRALEESRGVPAEKRAKIIMVSALSESGDIQKAFDLGCTAYAGKPVQQEVFENAVKKIIAEVDIELSN